MSLDPQTISFSALAISSVACAVSVTMLFLTLKRDRLKKGVEIRGAFSTTSSVACEDKYVSRIDLENQKDKAVTIFTIYLKLGNNYYVELDDFGDSPLILKPFETYHKEYGPLVYYAVNLNRILLNNLFQDRKVKKRLVLSTSEGKHVVETRIPMWNPVTEHFKNMMTGIIMPMRMTYKNQDVGSNIKFIIEFKYSEAPEEIVPIRPRDYEVKLFRHFQLTKESMENKTTLLAFLTSLHEQGILRCSSFEVHDAEEWRKEQFETKGRKELEAVFIGKFRYYVIGRLYSIWSSWKMNRDNKA